MPPSGVMTWPAPDRRKADSRSATTRNAASRRSTRSVRHSFDSSTAARSRFPRYSSLLASNFARSASASAVEPAKPASTCPLWSRRILRAPCFITVLPSVTCPSPAMALRPRWRTARIVVPWRVEDSPMEVARRRARLRSPSRSAEDGLLNRPFGPQENGTKVRLSGFSFQERVLHGDWDTLLSIVSVLGVLDALVKLVGPEAAGGMIVEVALARLDHHRLLGTAAGHGEPGNEIHHDGDVFVRPHLMQRRPLLLEQRRHRRPDVADDRLPVSAVGGLLDAEPHLPRRRSEHRWKRRGRGVGLRGLGGGRSRRGRGGFRGGGRGAAAHPDLPLRFQPRAFDVPAHHLPGRLQLPELRP